MQPWWVQTAVKHLNSPSVGWVTTTCWSGKILPPPTAISAVLVSGPGSGASGVWPVSRSSSGASVGVSSPPHAASTAGERPTVAARVRAWRRSGRDVMVARFPSSGGGSSHYGAEGRVVQAVSEERDVVWPATQRQTPSRRT